MRIEHTMGADYWECPCRQCWRMELDALDDSISAPTYAEWVADRSPVTPEPETRGVWS